MREHSFNWLEFSVDTQKNLHEYAELISAANNHIYLLNTDRMKNGRFNQVSIESRCVILFIENNLYNLKAIVLVNRYHQYEALIIDQDGHYQLVSPGVTTKTVEHSKANDLIANHGYLYIYEVSVKKKPLSKRRR